MHKGKCTVDKIVDSVNNLLQRSANYGYGQQGICGCVMLSADTAAAAGMVLPSGAEGGGETGKIRVAERRERQTRRADREALELQRTLDRDRIDLAE